MGGECDAGRSVSLRRLREDLLPRHFVQLIPNLALQQIVCENPNVCGI
jgi:hypothetical protein